MPDPREQSYQYNMLYQGLDQTETNGPPNGELDRGLFDPTTWFSDPREVVGLLLREFPDMEYWPDLAGNIIVDIPGMGGPRYLDLPTLSPADIEEFVGQFAMGGDAGVTIGKTIGGATGQAIGARIGSQLGTLGGVVGRLAGTGLGYALGGLADRYLVEPMRREALEGVLLPKFAPPSGTLQVRVQPDAVAGVLTAMRGAHRQIAGVTGAAVSESDFRRLFDPLVEMAGNGISLPYLQSFGQFYLELAAEQNDERLIQYYTEMANSFDEIMSYLGDDDLIAY